MSNEYSFCTFKIRVKVFTEHLRKSPKPANLWFLGQILQDPSGVVPILSSVLLVLFVWLGRSKSVVLLHNYGKLKSIYGQKYEDSPFILVYVFPDLSLAT